MEAQGDMTENTDNLNNILIEESGEEANEINLVGHNISGGAYEDEPGSMSGKLSKGRKHSRRSANQIEELEAFFKKNSHPDKDMLLELGMKLSMDFKQVKSWFQNKRTRMKSQLKRHENIMLKQESSKLRTEQMSMKEVMKTSICSRCGYQCTITDTSVDEQKLKLENDQLKDEVKRIGELADILLVPSTSLKGSMDSIIEKLKLRLLTGRNEFDGINVVDTASKIRFDFGNDLSSPLPVILSQPTIRLAHEYVISDKSKLMDLAFVAMNELLKLAETDEPLWVRGLDGGGETLNLVEYARSVNPFIDMKFEHFTTEATRASDIVFINSLALVKILMDKRRWVDLFPCIVGKTSTIDVIPTDVDGRRSGTLLLIKTELQIISDLISVRKIKFLRFCQQHAKDMWVIVDMSIDTIQEGSQQCETRSCRRLPSGCVVQGISNGYSKVTWIEHMKYNENVIHHLYRPLIKTGLGFGAQRWIATLKRQSEFLTMNKSFVHPIRSHEVCSNGKKSIGILAQRMTQIFCAMVCETNHKWETIQLENGEVAKLMMRKNIGKPGEPIGIVLSAIKTIRLPVEQQHLFEFLMNEQTRNQWDVLSYSGLMQQIVDIFKDQNHYNRISLFCVNEDATSANKKNMLILQETSTDATGSLLVYASTDPLAMKVVMNGGESSSVSLFPCGISIVPDCFQKKSGANNNDGSSGKTNNGSYSGSLVTISFQMQMNDLGDTNISLESAKSANDLISRTIRGIKTAFKCK